MLLKSHQCRFLTLAATACLVVPVATKATPIPPVRLKAVEYEVGIIYPSAKNTITSNFPFPNFMPGDRNRFITPGSDAGTSIDPSSTITLTSDRGPGPNQVYDKVSAVVALNGGGVSGGLHMIIEANTFYQVRVNVKPDKIPPANLTGVPIIGTSQGSTQCSGASVDATASVLAFPQDGQFTWLWTCKNGTVQPPVFHNTQDTNFPIGQPVDVNIEAQGSMTLQVVPVKGRDSATFASYADPVFEIDPSFPFADDFELDYSPGLDTPANGGTGVPEPGSLLLLALAAPLSVILRQRARWHSARA